VHIGTSSINRGLAMSSQSYRASFTLPREEATMLNSLAKRLGCSQSALLSVILGDTLPHLAQGLSIEVTQHGVTRRLVGDYADSLRAIVRDAISESRYLDQIELFQGGTR
jgi:hypothetical protein